MKRSFILALFGLLLFPFALVAQIPVKFHNEVTDTIRINQILTAHGGERGGSLLTALGREFLDVPYVASTLEGNDPEILVVNLDEMDCTTFVETVMALASTIEEGRSSWRDFIFNLQNIRYRGGRPDGYASRLHYISDWVVDNTHRGNFREVTADSPLATYEVKTLDFMTQNRQLYPALSADNVFQAMKNAEIGYRNHRFPVIKDTKIGRAAKDFLREGDIVALTSRKKGLDVSHLGIITLIDGEPYLLHASASGGKVIVDPLPLTRYVTKNRLPGIRVIRLPQYR